ncbi:hypothetical protein E4V51_31600 [Paenibacillus sp. 28ISP30-2]|nr:hypothetical protein [Paenibacillus sp. 28ISP30-2]
MPQAKIPGNPEYRAERLDFDLGASLTAGIGQIAQRDQVTMNAIVQTVWGSLLQKDKGMDEAVFGSVGVESTTEILNAEVVTRTLLNRARSCR